jgi:putative sterol carrier protein
VTGDGVCVEHIIGTDDLAFRYHVSVDASGARADIGAAQDPTVTFCQSYETAQAIRAGRLGAGEAVLLGRVEVRGDAAALVAHRGTLRAVDAVMGAID